MSTAIEKETQPAPTAAAEKDRAMFAGEKDPAMIVSFPFPSPSLPLPRLFSARRAPRVDSSTHAFPFHLHQRC